MFSPKSPHIILYPGSKMIIHQVESKHFITPGMAVELFRYCDCPGFSGCRGSGFLKMLRTSCWDTFGLFIGFVDVLWLFLVIARNSWKCPEIL